MKLKVAFGFQDFLSNPANIPWPAAVSSLYVLKENHYSHESVNVQPSGSDCIKMVSRETDNTFMFIKRLCLL